MPHCIYSPSGDGYWARWTIGILLGSYNLNGLIKEEQEMVRNLGSYLWGTRNKMEGEGCDVLFVGQAGTGQNNSTDKGFPSTKLC